jgi:hypothetical protein
MKKFKIMFASVAFLFAVVAAFASKNVSTTDSVDQYYILNDEMCEPTNCHPDNQGDPCEFQVYEEDELNPCSTLVTVETKRPI